MNKLFLVFLSCLPVLANANTFEQNPSITALENALKNDHIIAITARDPADNKLVSMTGQVQSDTGSFVTLIAPDLSGNKIYKISVLYIVSVKDTGRLGVPTIPFVS